VKRKTFQELFTLIEKGRETDPDNFSSAALKSIIEIGQKCGIDFKRLKTTYPQFDDRSALFYSLSIVTSPGMVFIKIVDEQALRGTMFDEKKHKEPPNDGGIAIPLVKKDLEKLYLRMFD